MNFYLAASSLIRSELALLTVSPYVFVGIGVLAVLLLAFAFKNKKSNSAEPAIESVTISSAAPAAGDDDLIAVIAAAVYAFGESAGQKLTVKSIRQVTARKEGRSVWASAGVYENTRPF